MKCGENVCPIPSTMLDPSRLTPAEKKATAEALYKTNEWTMPGIAEKLGVNDSTVSRWLSEFLHDAETKPRTSKRGRKGEGRPKSKRKPPKRHDKADQVAALADGGATNKDISKETGLSPRQVRHVVEEEAIRRDAEAQIDPATLSLTAQQKLEAAIRQRQRQLDQEAEMRINDEVKRRTETALPHLKTKLARADAISASYTPRFSKKECQDVARCLHPDSWQSLKVPAELAARLKAAFTTFSRMQNFLCVE